jgi:hypothetical protein
VSRAEIPYFQVNKREQMRLYKSLMNSEVSSYQQEELIEKDQRSLLIIGGIEVFLPHIPVEARTFVAEATAGEEQPTVTIMEEEKNMEQTLMFSTTEGDENSEEWLKIFSQEAGKEMTATLELAAKEEADGIDFVGLCE